jgi:hypothetical protein
MEFFFVIVVHLAMYLAGIVAGLTLASILDELEERDKRR